MLVEKDKTGYDLIFQQMKEKAHPSSPPLATPRHPSPPLATPRTVSRGQLAERGHSKAGRNPFCSVCRHCFSSLFFVILSTLAQHVQAGRTSHAEAAASSAVKTACDIGAKVVSLHSHFWPRPAFRPTTPPILLVSPLPSHFTLRSTTVQTSHPHMRFQSKAPSHPPHTRRRS